MKKTTFFKTLLLAAGLTMGSNAWADGTKRMLESEDYESATATDWTCPNASAVLKTGDATYGNYAQCYPGNSSGNRSCYKSVTYDYEPDGYTTADMTEEGYNIEFDFCLVSGNVEQRSVSQFVIPTTGPNLGTNSSYSGTDYIFSLSNSINFGLVAAGKSTNKNQVWYVNDLTNATETTVTLDENWYHMSMVVTATSVVSTISRNGETVISDTKTVDALPKITGFWKLLGRGSGKINFDNLEIYDYTAEATATAPTFTFKKVDGVSRIYTIANSNGSGSTLYYTTSPADEAPEVGDAAYSSTTSASKDVTFSETGKYYAYVLHSNGTTTSPVTDQSVTATALTLAAPVFTVTGMVQAEDGFYYPQVSFASDNSGLEGAPTATFNIESPYTFTGKGSVTVTVSAEGYTSSSSTYTVSNQYVVTKSIDFGALKASDFDTDVWESATGAPRDYWTNRAAAIPADVTYYYLSNTSAESGNPDNSAVLDGITISNYYQRTPQVYIGYGLLTPYTSVSGSSNTLNFKVNGATAEDLVVYNGWNNYGSGTFSTVQTGDAAFGLYRYDTMLRTIKVYSPMPSSVSTSITSAGYATFSSAYPVNISGVAGLSKAYVITGVAEDGKTLNLSEVTTIPANTGVVLEGAQGNYSIPVAASNPAAESSNKLVAVDEDITAEVGTYVLQNQDGKVGFYLVEDAQPKVAAGRAYLVLPTLAKARALYFNGEATGIDAVNALTAGEYVEIYNAAGVQVESLQKGLNIVKTADGKTSKVFVK